jgi:hypothetical protein
MLTPNRVTFAEQELDIAFVVPLQNQFIVDEKSFFIRFLLKLLPLPLKLEVLLVLKPEAKQKQKAERVALLLHFKQKSNPFVTNRYN